MKRKFLIAGSAVATTLVVHALLKAGWEKTTDEPVPSNPALPETSLGKSLIWTLGTASAVGVARLFVKKYVTEKYLRS